MHTGRIWGFSVEKWRTESHKKNVKYSSISGGQTLTPCKSPLGSSRKVPPTLFGYPWGRTTSWANNLSLVLRVPFPLLFPGARQQQLTDLQFTKMSLFLRTCTKLHNYRTIQTSAYVFKAPTNSEDYTKVFAFPHVVKVAIFQRLKIYMTGASVALYPIGNVQLF